MNNFFKLKNKIILLTGASGYIGKNILKTLISEKCKIILILRNKQSLMKIKNFINKKNIEIFYADLNYEKELDLALNQIKEKYSKIDGIINLSSDNSGLGSAIYKNGFNKFTNAFNNNLFAPLKIILELKNQLKKGKTIFNCASVINISSIYGCLSPDQNIYKKKEFVNPIDYGSAKASQIHLSKYLANDKDFKKIRFNNVILGPIPNQNKNFKNQIYKTKLIKKIPLGRLGIPDDVIGIILLLLSSKSSFINGSSISVDGGWSSH